MGDRAGGSADGADVGAQHGTGDEPVVVLECVAEVVHLIFAVVLAEHAEVVRDLRPLATRRGHGLEEEREILGLSCAHTPKYACGYILRSSLYMWVLLGTLDFHSMILL